MKRKQKGALMTNTVAVVAICNGGTKTNNACRGKGELKPLLIAIILPLKNCWINSLCPGKFRETACPVSFPTAKVEN